MNSVMCVACGNKTLKSYSWLSLSNHQDFLCGRCQNKLQRLKPPLCRKCHRMLSELPAEFVQGEMCYDCVRWEKWGGSLEKNMSLYVYNDYCKELMALFKYRGDYAIANIFAKDVHTALSELEVDYIVPIPLSGERLQERSFNQSEAFIQTAGLSAHNLLTRIHSEKQSKKSRQKRLNQADIFQIQTNFPIENKKIVLVDDIYTTGSTLQMAAQTLAEAGASHIISFTIAR